MSSMIAAIAAAATFRGNTLFVHYSTTENNLGTLYALSLPSTPAGGNNSNAILIQPQTILLNGPISIDPSQARSTSGSASLVSTATISPGGGYRHDLLLAFNMPTPFLFRLTPTSPNDGGDLSSSTIGSSWTLVDQSKSIIMAAGVSQLSLSSGTTGDGASDGQTSSEGSAVYELLNLPTSTTLVKMDVSGTKGLPYVPLTSVPSHQLSTATPRKVIRLTDSGKFDVVVVGGCNTTVATQDETCLWFSGEMGDEVLITYMPYDPTSCIVEANGSIIVATSTGIYTYPYTGIVQPGNWTVRQPPGMVPNLPSPILACSTANSTLYAVIQGDAGMPSIHSIDLTSSNWDWQTVHLLQSSANGTGSISLYSPGSSGGGESSSSSVDSKNSLSPAIIAVIIVVVVVALLLTLLAFLWTCRRSKRGSTFKMDDQTETTIVVPAPTHGYSPSYKESIVTISSGVELGGGCVQPDKQDYHEAEHLTNNHVSSKSAAQALPIQISRPWTPQDSVVQSSSTPIRANVIAGDKQELLSEEIVIPPNLAVTNHSVNQSCAYLKPGSLTSGANNPRIEHMISPGLANAQLILQLSQTPPIGPDGRHYGP